MSPRLSPRLRLNQKQNRRALEPSLGCTLTVAPVRAVWEFPTSVSRSPTVGCSLHGKSKNLFIPRPLTESDFFRVSSGYEWELSSANRAGSYVAVGFSADNKMGDDFVMACAGVRSVSTLSLSSVTNLILQNSKAELYWNAGKRKPDFLDTKEGILEYSLKREDNTLHCRIKT